MHKEGLETYKVLLILLFCISIRQDKEVITAIIKYIYHHVVITTYMTIKLQVVLFLASILTNK